jgi:putative two-component system response regulator
MTAWPADARILVVDDEPANVVLLRRMLAADGYTAVRTYDDPRALLRDAQDEEPDLVLMDLHMPGMDGLQLLGALRSVLPPGHFVPTLMLTADGTAQTRERALAAGAHDFLTKPFDLTEVRLRTRNLLATRNLYRQLAAQNALLASEVRDRTDDLHESRRELLQRLALAAEARDGDTYHHTLRVGRNAARLAEAIGLQPEECLLLRYAAPLHDIGKIGVPDRVLLKPGPLTADEFEQIKTHADLGGRILAGSGSDVLRMAEVIARQHHERWDGGGYPHGLRGAEIAMTARITSVVDVFDALTHARPYKPAWPMDRAVAEMASQRGAQFDPDVLDAFFEGVAHGHYHDEELHHA